MWPVIVLRQSRGQGSLSVPNRRSNLDHVTTAGQLKGCILLTNQGSGEESLMEMKFYHPLGDSLILWVGNEKEQKYFVVLFSKSGQAEAEVITRFKHMADCLSIPVLAS
ncbi:uncharacterized protein PAF06_020133 [Gastrophryne carolinensis]